MNETIELLHKRRSVVAKNMVPPGPTEQELAQILRAGMRVPDHGKLAPWRFVIFENEARTSFGNVLAKVFSAKNAEATPEQIEFERARFERAPLVIAVISTVLEKHPIPVWEQELSSGAACQNMLIAASAMGFGAQWLTEWYAFDPDVKDMLGLRSGERIAGFIYVGTAHDEPVERKRPRPHVGRWKA